MTLLGLAVVALALAAVPGFAERHAPKASPACLASLTLLTLFGLTLIPLAAAACLGVNALAPHRSPVTSAALLASAIGLSVLVVGRAAHELRTARGAEQHVDRVAVAAAGSPDAGLIVLPHDEPGAFSTERTIVVTTSLAQRLTAAQLDAVIAHERAHQRGRHGRLARWAHALRRGGIGTATIEHDLRHHLEAIADERAAQSVGDPQLVIDALELTGHAASGHRAARLRMHAGHDGRADLAVRAASAVTATITFVAVCVSFHTAYLALGLLACSAAGIHLWLLLRRLPEPQPR